jgi:hypothetical protein
MDETDRPVAAPPQRYLTVRQAAFIGVGAMVGAAAVVLVTFVFTTLIHEPASIVTLLAVLALSIGLDVWWKRVRAGRTGGGTTSDVQVGN